MTPRASNRAPARAGATTKSPLRIPLAATVADALVKSIQNGEWREALPSERALCARYQVSRPSIRQALARLEAEGWIRTMPRQIRRIGRPPSAASGRAAPAPPPRIVFLSAYPLDQIEPFVALEMLRLRQMLSDAGYRLDVAAAPDFKSERISRHFDGLVKSYPSAGWILYRAPEALQQWFAERRIPAVVMGSSYPAMRLPSVDVDFRATGRHAAGLMLGRGHQPDRIGLLLSGEHLAGIAAARAGFHDALGITAGADDPRVVTFTDRADLGRQLARWFQREPRPTGLIVQRPVYALSALGFLTARLRLALPGQVSLIALDDDPSLRYAVPEITRYTKSPERFIRRLMKLLLQRIEDPAVHDGHATLIMPDLIPGETLGPPPA